MHPYQVAVLCAIGTGWAVFGMRNSLIPLFVTEGLGRGPAAIGAGMAAATLMQGLILLPAGRFVDTQGRKKALLIGITVTILGVFVFAFFESFPLFLIGMGISGIGGAFLGSAPAALVGDIIRGRGGKVVALWQMGSDFGMIVGPIALGFIADHASYKVAFLTAALILVPALIRTMNLPETRKSHLPAIYEP
jgi:MFS family permease